MSNYPRLWSLFFNKGSVEVLENQNNRCEFRFILPEVFLDWLPPACTGYTRTAVALSGGSDVTVQEKSRSQEGSLHAVTYLAQWR
ncbi:MAG TPA: hypothetical protein VI382_04180 [Candidatus Manganitrophaceae bacterium]|nr:hypothetical protein [Candidatus Manganitrophaceae bacterium]